MTLQQQIQNIPKGDKKKKIFSFLPPLFISSDSHTGCPVWTDFPESCLISLKLISQSTPIIPYHIIPHYTTSDYPTQPYLLLTTHSAIGAWSTQKSFCQSPLPPSVTMTSLLRPRMTSLWRGVLALLVMTSQYPVTRAGYDLCEGDTQELSCFPPMDDVMRWPTTRSEVITIFCRSFFE